MKNEEWISLKKAYEAGDLSGYRMGEELDSPYLKEGIKGETPPFRQRIKKFFLKEKEEEREMAAVTQEQEKESVEAPRFLRTVPADEQELKQSFLDYFYPFQLKWAVTASDEGPLQLGGINSTGICASSCSASRIIAWCYTSRCWNGRMRL